MSGRYGGNIGGRRERQPSERELDALDRHNRNAAKHRLWADFGRGVQVILHNIGQSERAPMTRTKPEANLLPNGE